MRLSKKSENETLRTTVVSIWFRRALPALSGVRVTVRRAVDGATLLWSGVCRFTEGRLAPLPTAVLAFKARTMLVKLCLVRFTRRLAGSSNLVWAFSFTFEVAFAWISSKKRNKINLA